MHLSRDTFRSFPTFLLELGLELARVGLSAAVISGGRLYRSWYLSRPLPTPSLQSRLPLVGNE